MYGKREVLTPRLPPPPYRHHHHHHHHHHLFPSSDCTANCKTCQGSFCSVCEQGHALFKGFRGLGKGRCLRKCPKGYKTGVNPSGGNKCVRCKCHKLCSIYPKTAVARHPVLTYWPLWSPKNTSLWRSNKGLKIPVGIFD